MKSVIIVMSALMLMLVGCSKSGKIDGTWIRLDDHALGLIVNVDGDRGTIATPGGLSDYSFEKGDVKFKSIKKTDNGYTIDDLYKGGEAEYKETDVTISGDYMSTKVLTGDQVNHYARLTEEPRVYKVDDMEFKLYQHGLISADGEFETYVIHGENILIDDEWYRFTGDTLFFDDIDEFAVLVE